ncbi:5,6-dimethylbenzimidazole synthase [Kamptonema cortianum]|nr:5,6-dimethylbenzimidazole synthase [Oscillatoria laete-virens]MDK3156417.1 5,6-dimethylbenzimidazole synthase [Kamptonema cortianum]MDL5046275.1 5,6-dimethylbenzimidazole synthase [Oscillatoria amoena NRMC-F 0135]MDL5053904.1 5,6-dimethylbenzimidazole synthase [Oscillatoria laete-virens NRMC-F 0139]
MREADINERDREGFYRVLYSRRDIRKFKPGRVPDDVVERILCAAHAAPSVGLSQPWRFILIRSPETRARVKELFASVNAAQSGRIDDPARRELYDSLKLEGILESDFNLAVVCEPPPEDRFTLGAGTIPQTIRDSVCLAIQNLWLAARAEGVGVGWVSILPEGRMEDILGLPARAELVAYLCVGYPEEFADRPMLETVGWEKRLPLEQMVMQEKWKD